MTTPWHPDAALVERYAGGHVDGVLAASLEQHLARCGACRDAVAVHAPAARLDGVWAGVLERVQAPHVGGLERLLHRVGVDASTARLAVATPALRGAWLLGVVLVLALAALAAGSSDRGAAVFLALAPVLPVAGVALVFGPDTDPTHEVAAAAPYPPDRLLAVRSAVVLASTLVPALGLSLLVPADGWHPVAWLLPSLALTVLTVALGTRVRPVVVGAALALVWVGAVLGPLVREADPWAVASPAVQVASAVLLVAGLATLALERRALPELLRRVP